MNGLDKDRKPKPHIPFESQWLKDLRALDTAREKDLEDLLF
jgi:hypothetical protein